MHRLSESCQKFNYRLLHCQIFPHLRKLFPALHDRNAFHFRLHGFHGKYIKQLLCPIPVIAVDLVRNTFSFLQYILLQTKIIIYLYIYFLFLPRSDSGKQIRKGEFLPACNNGSDRFSVSLFNLTDQTVNTDIRCSFFCGNGFFLLQLI